LATEQYQQQPPQQHRRGAVAAAAVIAAVVAADAAGERDTLLPAADATWRPEMNYGRFRVPSATRCIAVFVILTNDITTNKANDVGLTTTRQLP